MPSDKDNLRLEGENIFLRTLDIADASAEYCSWLNDPEVNKYLETRRATIAEVRDYVAQKRADPECLFLGIFWQATGEHLGNIKLEPIDWATGEATLGLLIGNKKFWGRGVGSEAVRLLSDYALGPLGLNRISLGVIAGHQAAIRVYEKCGFIIKKVESKAVNHGGQLFDKVWMEKIKS